jgi:hypothetical protein
MIGRDELGHKKDGKQTRGTHTLKRAGGGGQVRALREASEGHSRSGKGRECDKSRHRNKPSQARGTYELECPGRGTNQDRKKVSKANDTHELESGKGGISEERECLLSGGTYELESVEEGMS